MFDRMVLCFAALFACSAQAESPEALLRRADAWRLDGSQMRVETRIEVLKNGELDKDRLYSVYLRPNRLSLVLMRSPAEKGQKVLMKGDDFWMILPPSQRPLRITPTQKLIGDAAAGDIATLSWSADYDIATGTAERCGEAPCEHLSLKAKRTSTTYARIELWVATKNAQPLRAELYVVSDKLAKRASFETGRVEGRPAVVKMIIDDAIMTNRRTVLHYLARSEKSVPDEWFNPMFLTRNEVTP